jgi:hypothetical protein
MNAFVQGWTPEAYNVTTEVMKCRRRKYKGSPRHILYSVFIAGMKSEIIFCGPRMSNQLRIVTNQRIAVFK